MFWIYFGADMTDNNNQKAAGFRPELFALAAQKAKGDKKLPPVHLWNPEFCGDIDMRINRDGSWDYMGTPISRKRMVKLFSTILRRDDDQYYLVTPVEKVGIKVVDAPFIVVEIEVEEKQILFRTNLDDYVKVGKENPIRVNINDKTGEPTPYVLVRDRLEALISRSVYYQLADLAVEKDGQYGVWSGGEFFPLN
jgi:hypothetical protein